MTIPTVYKSTDGNAPVLCGTRTSLVNVLQKCLVDGYGDKPPAGWTMPYINIDKTRACFRNNPAIGTGFFLRVQGDTGSNPYQSRLCGFEIMTSENDGSFSFGSSTSDFSISTSSDTVARPWIIIATDTWVYFFNYYTRDNNYPSTYTVVWDYGSSIGCHFFFGDFEKYSGGDYYNCALFQSYPNDVYSFGYAMRGDTTGQSRHYLARSSSGSPGAVNCAISIPPPCAYQCFMGGQGHSYSSLSGLIVGKACINAGASYTLRGFLPGVLVPLHPSPFENLSIVSLLDGNDYLVVSFRNRQVTGAYGIDQSSQLLFYIGPTP